MIKMEEINMEMHLLEFNDRFSRLENEGLLPPRYIQISPVFHHRFFIFLYIPYRNNYTLYNNNKQCIVFIVSSSILFIVFNIEKNLNDDLSGFSPSIFFSPPPVEGFFFSHTFLDEKSLIIIYN